MEEKKKILTEQNRAQVEVLVTQAMTNLRLVRYTEEELRILRASVERHEAILAEAQRERKRYNRELEAIGFHDLGHARTELGH